MANNDLVRDPDLEEAAERELWARRMAAGAAARPNVPTPSGAPLPAAPYIPSGRYTGATEMPRTPAAAGEPLGPGPTFTPSMGTMPRVKPTRITMPQAPAGSIEDTQNQLEEARYQREHPLGTVGTLSGRSGTGGKILHVLGRIGNIAGQAVVPNLMPTIPGTDVYNRLKEANLGERLERQTREASEAGYRSAEAEKAREEAARLRAPVPKRLEGPQDSWTSGEGTQWHNYEFKNGQTAYVPEGEDPNNYDPTRGMPSTGARPTAPPPEGTLPAYLQPSPAAPTPAPGPATQVPFAPPTPAPPAAAAATQRPGAVGGYYGKPTAEDRRLTDAEKTQNQAELTRRFQAMYPNQALDPAYKLGANATVADYNRLSNNLKEEEAVAGRKATELGAAETRRQREAQEQFNRQMKEQENQRQKEKAQGEWVRAVEAAEPNKVHVMTRGDYDAHPHDFKPYPGSLPTTEVDKITADAKRLNEMQGAMNAAAEAIHNYGYDQNDLVVQALQKTEESYPDKVIGIPIVDYLAQNLKKLGLSGANGPTREYIINLLSLREAMLALPKEITEGSRQVQSSIEALYSTLPGGTTPDRDYAMRQMYRVQGILDRVRGTTIPIVEGMRMVNKLPELYKYKGIKGGQPVFSDDNKAWVDERGNAIR